MVNYLTAPKIASVLACAQVDLAALLNLVVTGVESCQPVLLSTCQASIKDLVYLLYTCRTNVLLD